MNRDRDQRDVLDETAIAKKYGALRCARGKEYSPKGQLLESFAAIQAKAIAVPGLADTFRPGLQLELKGTSLRAERQRWQSHPQPGSLSLFPTLAQLNVAAAAVAQAIKD